jgi:hypothetical protein
MPLSSNFDVQYAFMNQARTGSLVGFPRAVLDAGCVCWPNRASLRDLMQEGGGGSRKLIDADEAVRFWCRRPDGIGDEIASIVHRVEAKQPDNTRVQSDLVSGNQCLKSGHALDELIVYIVAHHRQKRIPTNQWPPVPERPSRAPACITRGRATCSNPNSLHVRKLVPNFLSAQSVAHECGSPELSRTNRITTNVRTSARRARMS